MYKDNRITLSYLKQELREWLLPGPWSSLEERGMILFGISLAGFPFCMIVGCSRCVEY